MNITSLSPEEMAKVLDGAGITASGTGGAPDAQCPVPSASMIEADIQAGAPVGADGKMNLIHYCAWLAAQVHR